MFEIGAGRVWIDRLRPMSGGTFVLLHTLVGPFLQDYYALEAPEKYRALRGNVLAQRLKIKPQSVRQRVVRFRRAIRRSFQEELQIEIGDNDIIQNNRDWAGYRLNPWVVMILKDVDGERVSW